MGLLGIIIKKLVLSGYNPAEDLLELGIDAAVGMVFPDEENINNQLKEAGLIEAQITAAKVILAESANRYIPSTPAAVYERNADAMIIARQIFIAFVEVQGSGEDIPQKIQLSLEDEDTKEQIIKGISIIVQKAIDLCLTSPDYSAYLTKQLNMAKMAINKTDRQVSVQDGQLKDHENRIANIEQDRKQRSSITESNIEAYYEYVKGLYTKRYKGNTLLGEESLSELYMQPFYYKAKKETDDVEQLLEEFCSKGECGVLWIVGEPGHGKTSMCIKAIADYVNKRHYKSVSGVFWFRLNPQGIPELVESKKLALKTAFSWEKDGDRSETIKPDEIRGSLVFLDGFDELKATLEKNSISKDQFFIQVNQLAEAYQMHIVIMSRTQALVQDESHILQDLETGCAQITCKFRDGSSQKNDVKLLAPLTFEQQILWIDDLVNWRKNNNENTVELESYRQGFPSLQKNKDIAGLLEVPILLRMIVQNSFIPTSGNRVHLYRDLFDMTLLRQGLEDQQEELHAIYRKIAFRIFVYDDDCAEVNKKEFAEIEGSDAYLYQYYLHSSEIEKGVGKEDIYCVTFLHRTFYQYFLCEFFYDKLTSVKDDQGGEDFLKYLWARHLDDYVLENLYYRAKSGAIEYPLILTAIEKTDAFLPDYANTYDLNESIGNYDKANNTFWNAVSICNMVFQKEKSKEKLDLTGRIVELLSKYNCSRIHLGDLLLNSANLSSADLSYANLISANLSSADLSSADLTSANLITANLNSADLSSADLSSADLRFANLISANLDSADLRFANLSYSKLSSANLSYSKLSYANLSYANLSSANLSYANLSSVNLRRAVFVGTIMDGADVENAIVSSRQYDYISRANVKNLDKIIVINNNR